VVRYDADLDAFRFALATQHLHLGINETDKPLYSIQNGFNLQLNG
jgi:hypothetical protein